MKALGHQASFPGEVVDEVALQRGSIGSKGVTSRQRDHAKCLRVAIPPCS